MRYTGSDPKFELAMDRAAAFDAQPGRALRRASEQAFALVAACCRWPVDIDAVRAAAMGATDWRIVVQMTRRHRVAGLVHAAAERASLPLPDDIADELAGETRQIALQALVHAHECVRLQRLFDRAGIRVLFLKGVALSELAYGTLTVKQARDIDLLVPSAQALDALACLHRDGYALRAPGRHLRPAQLKALVAHGSQAELHRSGGRLKLELHWRLSPNSQLPHSIDPFAAVETTTLPGIGNVNVLRPDDEFVYLCVHGAGHAWSRLKWLADLNARLSAFDAHQVASFYAYAQACGADLCAGQALLLCHRLLGRTLPEDLRIALSADARLGRLMAIAEQRIHADDPGSATARGAVRTFQNIIGPFRLSRGPRFLAAQMREVLIGPGDPIRLPLPRALVFLYPFLRVPLWLWRQWPRRGKRALQAATRR